MIIGVDARVLTQKELRGISNYLIEVLKAWPDERDEFILFYESGEICRDINELSNKINCIRVPEPPGTRIKIWHWLGMPKALKNISLDVLWCPANIPIPFTSHRQILTIHDTLLQESFSEHNLFDNIFYKILVPYFTRKFVHQVITVSKFSKSRINLVFGISEERIKVIYNGATISVNATPFSKEEARTILKESGITSGPFIFALGAISPWKNTELLLRAFASVSKQTPQLLLVISGIQKEAMSKYNDIAVKLGLSHKVQLLSFVPSSTKNALYRASELFVYPSLFEGFGLPPLEAMSMGCPVVASDKASIPEVVGNGALLADCTSAEDLANKILMVLKDERLRNRLTERGFARLKFFTWEKSARKHWEIFKEGLS